jgi:hypothetical protein
MTVAEERAKGNWKTKAKAGEGEGVLKRAL